MSSISERPTVPVKVKKIAGLEVPTQPVLEAKPMPDAFLPREVKVPVEDRGGGLTWFRVKKASLNPLTKRLRW